MQRPSSLPLRILLIATTWGATSILQAKECEALLELQSWNEERISEFQATLGPEATTLRGPPESRAFTRKGRVLSGNFNPEVKNDRSNGHADVFPIGKSRRLGGTDYLEFTNSTAMSTVDPRTGQSQELLLARGIRPYKNRVVPSGSQSPEKYVSDVLLFRRGMDGEFKYVRTLLRSNPAKHFLFEDPRVSILSTADGNLAYFLSGTDYSPHVEGTTNPDVMNRYVPIKLDTTGLPEAIPTDSTTGKPAFLDLSPAPVRHGSATSFIDAKNATIYQNEQGQIVVRTRLRPDFADPWVAERARGEKWKYAEQVFVFRDLAHLQSYDWKNCIDDLFAAPNAAAPSHAQPLSARTVLKDADLTEHFRDAHLVTEKGKGLGPGTIPVRLRRQGNHLYLSETKGAEELDLGKIPTGASIPIPEGEARYVTFDHEIRYFQDRGFLKRHYTASIKLWNAALTHIEIYKADAIQPIEGYERGENSGIVDLHHVYPMGRIIGRNASGKPVVKVFAGVSDAHTAQYDFDMMNLLTEMATIGK